MRKLILTLLILSVCSIGYTQTLTNDDKTFIRLNANTKFKPVVENADGERIEAPAVWFNKKEYQST